MEELGKLIDIAFFLITAFIFGIFIKPQIKKLNELKEKFNHFSISKNSDKQDEEIDQLHSVFEQYGIEYSILKNLVQYFERCIYIVLGIFGLMVTYQDFKGYSGGLINDELVVYSILVILGIAILMYLVDRALNIYIPNEDQLNDFSFLTQRQGIKNDQLVNAIDFSLSTERPEDNFEEARKDEISFKINTHLKIHGYKYLFIIFEDKTEDLIYSSCGLIDNKSDHKFFFIPKPKDLTQADKLIYWRFWSVKIGKLPRKNIKSKLLAYLFIFDPCVINNECSPLYAKGTFGYEHENQFYLSNLHISDENPFRPIKYAGKGMKFSYLKWGNDLQKYYSDEKCIEGVKGIIETYGEVIRNIKKPCRVLADNANHFINKQK